MSLNKPQQNNQRIGDNLWAKMPKINSELFTLTYGAMVMQLIKDHEEIDEVNKQLEKIGYNIGIRIIDEFLAKSGVTSCTNFRDTVEIISKVAFKMFLGISIEVSNWGPEGSCCSLLIFDNPFTDFVSLPPQYSGLVYCNILCGIIKGALEMVQLQVECKFIKDILAGDDVTELRVELKGTIGHEVSDEYKEN